MSKVTTDKEKINEVLSRGVEMVYPSRKALEKELASGRRLRVYCGFDPSADSLHIGNAIQINKLSQFQELGHEIVFLIGDLTGMIGDPTDKLATRKKLTREEVLENAKSYKEQAASYLSFGGKNPAIIRYNSEWGDKLTFRDIIELSSNFTVQQMIQRDMFQERLRQEKPVHLHEFLYPLAQAYDSVALDIDLEIGGSDQMFNMMCGRDLVGSVKGREKYVITTKLLADDKGKKMGKSEGNAVFLDNNPHDIYGIVMSWPDGVIVPGFELCTKLPMNEVARIRKVYDSEEENPRDLKMKLAFEITRIVHGEKAALEAEKDFVKRIQEKDAGHISETAEPIKLPDGLIITELLVRSGLAASKGEAKRLIAEGAIKVANTAIKDPEIHIVLAKEGTLIQRGKKQAKKIFPQ